MIDCTPSPFPRPFPRLYISSRTVFRLGLPHVMYGSTRVRSRIVASSILRNTPWFMYFSRSSFSTVSAFRGTALVLEGLSTLETIIGISACRSIRLRKDNNRSNAKCTKTYRSMFEPNQFDILVGLNNLCISLPPQPDG